MSQAHSQHTSSPIDNAVFYPVSTIRHTAGEVPVHKPMPQKPKFHGDSYITPPTTHCSSAGADMDLRKIGFRPIKNKTSDRGQPIGRRAAPLAGSLLIPDACLNEATRPALHLLPRNNRDIEHRPTSANSNAPSSISRSSVFPTTTTATTTEHDRAVTSTDNSSSDGQHKIVLLDVSDASSSTTSSLPYLNIDADTPQGKLPPISLTMKLTASRIQSPRNQSQFDRILDVPESVHLMLE